jgi:hypothetical protein
LIDSLNQFSWYKNDNLKDITLDYFENPDNIKNKNLNNVFLNYNHSHQFINYVNLDFENMLPIINKYFTLSSELKVIVREIEKEYILDYENICVLFYRGNDKNRETKICGYDEYIKYANIVISKNPNVKFLIQSDETEFIHFMKNSFPNNSFYFKNKIRHINKCDSTVDIIMRSHNYKFSKYYLGITVIMSKCKYIICGSGNCSMWIMFYRGNCKNVFQNLNGIWISN